MDLRLHSAARNGRNSMPFGANQSQEILTGGCAAPGEVGMNVVPPN